MKVYLRAFTYWFLLLCFISQTLFAGPTNDSESVQFEISEPDPKLIKENSPMSLESPNSRWNKFYNHGLNFGKGSYNFMAYEFAPSASAFYLGCLLQVIRKMITSPEKDAEMLRNFFVNQIFSVQAQVSFIVFLLGAKAGNVTFKYVLDRFGWLKDEKKVKELMQELSKHKKWGGPNSTYFTKKGLNPNFAKQLNVLRQEAERLVPGRVTSAAFTRTSMFVGFGFGFTISTLFSDIINDPDISYWADSMVSSPDEIDKLIIKHGYTPLEASQRAYDRWVTRGKIVDYTPHLLSAWTTIGVQSFILPKAAKATKKLAVWGIKRSSRPTKKIALKSIQFLRNAAKLLPESRLLSTALHAFLFLEINEPILHLYEDYYTKKRYGDSLNEQLNTLNELKLRPEISADCLNDYKKLEKFDQNIIDQTPYSKIIRQAELSEYSGCSQQPISYSEQLTNFHHNLNSWRDFWFKEPKHSINSWSTYLSSINTQISSSYKFYKSFIEEVNNKDSVSFETFPFYGLVEGSIKDASKNDQSSDLKSVKSPISNEMIQRTLANIFLLLEKNINDLEKKKRTDLDEKVLKLYKGVFYYFSILDSKKPIPKELSETIKSINSSNLASDLKSDKIQNEKDLFVAKGIRLFTNAISADSDLKNEKANKTAELGSLKQLLKTATPLLEGEFFVNDMSLDKEINPDQSNTQSDEFHGRLSRNLAEQQLLYLACGPAKEESSSRSEKIINYSYLHGLKFTPPRLVSVGKFNACEEKVLASSTDGTIYYNTGSFKFNGKDYSNLAQFAKDNLSEKYKGSNAIQNFENFWKEAVQSEIDELYKKENKNFNTLLKDSITPSLFNKGKYDKIPIGIYQSYQFEVTTYIEVLKKILPEQTTILDKAKTIFMLYQFIVSNPKNPSSWKDYSSQLDLSDESSSIDLILSASKNPYTSAYLSLLYLKAEITKNLLPLNDEKANSLSTDQIEAIIKLVDLTNMALNGMTDTLSYFNLFEVIKAE